MDIKELFEYSKFDFSGTEDFVSVIDIEASLSYEWDEFHAWYSPNERRYYVATGQGCSCNWIGEEYGSKHDLDSYGSRTELMKIVTDYFDRPNYDRTYSADDRVKALYTVNSFNPNGR